jgi:ABC-type Mn2+/Zn2+ transport system ATPase subunit
MEENKNRKAEFNKLIKDHLKYNKKIVMTLMTHKIGEESKNFKEKLNVNMQLCSNLKCSDRFRKTTCMRKMRRGLIALESSILTPNRNAKCIS